MTYRSRSLLGELSCSLNQGGKPIYQGLLSFAHWLVLGVTPLDLLETNLQKLRALAQGGRATQSHLTQKDGVRSICSSPRINRQDLSNKYRAPSVNHASVRPSAVMQHPALTNVPANKWLLADARGVCLKPATRPPQNELVLQSVADMAAVVFWPSWLHENLLFVLLGIQALQCSGNSAACTLER